MRSFSCPRGLLLRWPRARITSLSCTHVVRRWRARGRLRPVLRSTDRTARCQVSVVWRHALFVAHLEPSATCVLGGHPCGRCKACSEAGGGDGRGLRSDMGPACAMVSVVSPPGSHENVLSGSPFLFCGRERDGGAEREGRDGMRSGVAMHLGSCLACVPPHFCPPRERLFTRPDGARHWSPATAAAIVVLDDLLECWARNPLTLWTLVDNPFYRTRAASTVPRITLAIFCLQVLSGSFSACFVNRASKRPCALACLSGVPCWDI